MKAATAPQGRHANTERITHMESIQQVHPAEAKARELGWERFSRHGGRTIVWTTNGGRAMALGVAGARVVMATTSETGRVLGYECSWRIDSQEPHDGPQRSEAGVEDESTYVDEIVERDLEAQIEAA